MLRHIYIAACCTLYLEFILDFYYEVVFNTNVKGDVIGILDGLPVEYVDGKCFDLFLCNSPVKCLLKMKTKNTSSYNIY